jgi:predicted DNA-binding transcriptional regulator AlpA
MRHAAHDDPQVANLPPELLDLQQVARVCQFSPRHVLRMAEAGRMPPPVKVGRCARWSRRTIENWITAGCPRVNATSEQHRTRPD